MGSYEIVKEFKKKYPFCLSWRIKSHSKILDKFLNPDEKIVYAFVGQKNEHSIDLFTTSIVALTTRRMLIVRKRLLWGYFVNSITPDLFNDLTINKGLIWGKIIIDTVKEEVRISNIQSKALDEIETQISTFMMEEKKKYVKMVPKRD